MQRTGLRFALRAGTSIVSQLYWGEQRRCPRQTSQCTQQYAGTQKTNRITNRATKRLDDWVVVDKPSARPEPQSAYPIEQNRAEKQEDMRPAVQNRHFRCVHVLGQNDDRVRALPVGVSDSQSE